MTDLILHRLQFVFTVIYHYLFPQLTMGASPWAGIPMEFQFDTNWARFLVGFPLALAYLVVVFRLHRGKAVAAQDGEGY